MYRPSLAPVADSLALSAVVALAPLLVFFFMLSVARAKAHWAALTSVAAALSIAIAIYAMPARLAVLSALEGAVFGLFPIMWIVLFAIWIYELTAVTLRFEDLRQAFGMISGDLRIQALLIAFCFGTLLEGLAGFGAPVAITGVMLVALDFSPVRAAVIALVANTAPVAFGAFGIPIITAGVLTGIPYTSIGAYTGRQTPILALVVPFILLVLVDGRRGLREAWPAGLVCGLTFALVQFIGSNYVSVELTDIFAALVTPCALIMLLRVWQPVGATRRRDQSTGEPYAVASHRGAGFDTPRPTDDGMATQHTEPVVRIGAGRLAMALAPYIVIIAVFSLAKLWDPVKEFLVGRDLAIRWPGLHGEVAAADGRASTMAVYTFQWLSSSGTLLLVSGIVVAFLYRVSPGTAGKMLFQTAIRLRHAVVTVASVLALAYVMNLSGQTITVGAWIAGTGAAFAFLSPLVGWLGTAVTGSDTSSNALFATMQQGAAGRAGLDPTLLVAANTSGGVLGKMISPQNLAIAATAVGLTHQEGMLFRRVIGWSLLLLLVMCVLVYLQSTVLSWMLP